MGLYMACDIGGSFDCPVPYFLECRSALNLLDYFTV